MLHASQLKHILSTRLHEPYISCVTAPSPFLLQVHYDGWSNVYDEWMDSDHPDIHPAGWCEATGHPLKIPPRDTKTQQSHGSKQHIALVCTES